MSRCQHCKKLTHSEDLYVYFSTEDFEKVVELQELSNWTPKYLYANSKTNLNDLSLIHEYGKLKCGDIYIHFVCKQ
jgi:hypothetical protein